jgi:signal transduction histidine kinase/DNA-binding LytR/AlgR family response regulator
VAIPIRVLVLEDRPADALLAIRELVAAGFEPEWQRVETEFEFVAHLSPDLDVIIADHRLPQFDAKRALSVLNERGLDIVFIVVSGAVGEGTAVDLLRNGAADYLLKDRLARLGPAVARGLERRRLRAEARRTDERHAKIRVLVLEDSEADAELAMRAIADAGFEPDWERVETKSDYLAHLLPNVDVIVADYTLPQFDAEQALDHLNALGLDTVFIVVSGTIGEEAAVNLMRNGAADYVFKDRPARLGPAVARALEQRRLRAEARLAEAAIAATAAKSQFLANMSHELRTPLSAILGFAELLIDDSTGRFTAAQHKVFLENIYSSGKHLLGLINDILDISKIEAGHMELRLEQVDVELVVANVIGTTQPLADHKRIALRAEALPGGRLVADSGRLNEMLLNLVSNAIKFTPEGGTVEITTQRTTDKIEISVSDTGIGISQTDKGRIFQEFQQLNAGDANPIPGTGLGLAITRHLARLHGGDVRLRSELGKGSTFTLSLPLAGPNQEAPAPERIQTVEKSVQKSIQKSAGRLVLIAEDNPLAADLMMHNLEQGGFLTEVAETGPAVLAKARELRPMAITLDVRLPELDGWEVLKQLKQDEATRGIPVIVVSVVDNPELGRALGAFDYFVKPVPAKDLLERLSHVRLEPSAGGKSFHVLVVDDEEPNRTWLAQVLELAGYTVTLAAGGADAIRLALSGQMDLVLLDLMMPDVTGFDVVEALRANEATRAIPIMVLTAKDLTDDDKRQLNGHVSAILSGGSTASSDLLAHLQEVAFDSRAAIDK